MAEPHPALDEVVDDLGDEDEGGLVIIEPRMVDAGTGVRPSVRKGMG